MRLVAYLLQAAYSGEETVNCNSSCNPATLSAGQEFTDISCLSVPDEANADRVRHRPEEAGLRK